MPVERVGNFSINFGVSLSLKLRSESEHAIRGSTTESWRLCRVDALGTAGCPLYSITIELEAQFSQTLPAIHKSIGRCYGQLCLPFSLDHASDRLV